MWYVPSWAIGVAVIIVAVSIGRVLRQVFRTDASWGRKPSQPDLAQFRESLDDVQKRLGELEDRLDFTERLLAKQRDGERLAPPRG